MKEESFDLLIYGHILNTFVLGVGDHFKCPIIVFTPIGVSPGIGNIVGHPNHISAVPNYFVPMEKMGLVERFKTFFGYTVEYLLTLYTEYRNQKYYTCVFY
jgi:hypothetical protein